MAGLLDVIWTPIILTIQFLREKLRKWTAKKQQKRDRRAALEAAVVGCIDRAHNRLKLSDLTGGEITVEGSGIAEEVHDNLLIVIGEEPFAAEKPYQKSLNTSRYRSHASNVKSRRIEKITEIEMKNFCEVSVPVIDIDTLKWILRGHSFKNALVREVNKPSRRVLLVDIITGQEIMVFGNRISRKIKDSQIIGI